VNDKRTLTRPAADDTGTDTGTGGGGTVAPRKRREARGNLQRTLCSCRGVVVQVEFETSFETSFSHDRFKG
jgi:hypothetical protein